MNRYSVLQNYSGGAETPTVSIHDDALSQYFVKQFEKRIRQPLGRFGRAFEHLYNAGSELIKNGATEKAGSDARKGITTLSKAAASTFARATLASDAVDLVTSLPDNPVVPIYKQLNALSNTELQAGARDLAASGHKDAAEFLNKLAEIKQVRDAQKALESADPTRARITQGANRGDINAKLADLHHQGYALSTTSVEALTKLAEKRGAGSDPNSKVPEKVPEKTPDPNRKRVFAKAHSASP